MSQEDLDILAKLTDEQIDKMLIEVNKDEGPVDYYLDRVVA